MSTSETERGRAVGRAAVATVSAGIAIVLLAFGGNFATAGSADFSPTKESIQHLKETLRNLNEARVANSREQLRYIFEAEHSKKEFVASIYQSHTAQSLLGCSDRTSRGLFFSLENVDLEIEMALRGKAGKRSARLGHGAFAASDVAKRVDTCLDADEGARVIAREIASRARALADAEREGKLGDRELKKASVRIASLKRQLFGGQTIYDCDAFGVYELVKDIDIRLLQAEEEDDPDRRDQLVAIGHRSARELSELWDRAPCDTECSDKRDNDGDGLIDAGDFGCQTGPQGTYKRGDQSEQHHEVSSPNCSILADHNTLNIFIGQPNAGSKMVGHMLRNVTDGQLLIARRSGDSDFSFSNPMPLEAGVCGPGTTATVEWVREGLEMKWHVAVSKDTAGVTPADKRIVAAADTR